MIPPAKALLRVGGEWVHTHAHYGDLEVTDRADGGVWSLSWSMNLPAGEHMPWLAPNSRVELYAGSLRWSGTLTDPDWDSGRFTADGWCRQAENAAALNNTSPTNDLGWALFWASGSFGRGAINFSSLETFTPLPDSAREVNSLAALLDQWSLENGRRWAVNERRGLYTSTDPTTPTLWVLPGVVDLSASTALQATHVIAEYLTTSLTRLHVEAGSGARVRERLVSLEDLGPISAGRAQTIASEIYRRSGGGKPVFTTGFEVAPGQVVDAFGPVDLSLIRPMSMIRIHGCDDPRTGAPYTDLVIGETVWRPQEGRVQVNPVDLDAADFEAIVEELGGSVIF